MKMCDGKHTHFWSCQIGSYFQKTFRESIMNFPLFLSLFMKVPQRNGGFGWIERGHMFSTKTTGNPTNLALNPDTFIMKKIARHFTNFIENMAKAIRWTLHLFSFHLFVWINDFQLEFSFTFVCRRLIVISILFQVVRDYWTWMLIFVWTFSEDVGRGGVEMIEFLEWNLTKLGKSLTISIPNFLIELNFQKGLPDQIFRTQISAIFPPKLSKKIWI